MDSVPIIIGIFVVIATIGLFVARWTIKQYDRAPHYTYSVDSKECIYSSRGLNEDNENSDHSQSKLQTRLPHYSGPNPFTIRRLNSYERFKVYLFCISGIALIRMMIFIVSLIGVYFVSLVITMCTAPDGTIHAYLIKFIRLWMGIALFNFGFFFIDYSDSRSEQQKEDDNNPFHPVRVIVANHCTIFDGLVILWKTNGIIAAKKEISAVPIIGRILGSMQTLWIDRSGSKGRNYAKQQIIDHVKDYTAPPLVIFPQGTTSNVQCVTSFKTGAYLANEKVMEVALNWSQNKSCDVSFVSDIPSLAHLIHVGCCQFINSCQVDIANSHSPNQKEKNDSGLFAENSRKFVVGSLQKYNENKKRAIRATEHSYSDWKLLQKAFKSNENFNTSHLLINDIINDLRLRTKTVCYLAERFGELDLSKSGFIDYEEFCSAFNRDPNEDSKQLRDLFSVFNTENDNLQKISFDEFLVGVSTCFVDDKIKDALKIMFNANKGETSEIEYILKQNILNTYSRHMDKTKFESKEKNGYDEWMKKMETFVNQTFGKKDKLSFDEFCESVEKNRYEFMVQHYLQSILLVRLKIKLKKDDFAINNIYVNPLAMLVQSSSIQSAH